MKSRLTCLLIFVLAAALLMAPAAYAAEDGLFSSGQEEQASPAWVRILPEALDPDVTQLFVVAGLGMDKTTATISLHERDENGAWKQLFSTPGFVGKYGLVLDSERREGCGRTPGTRTSRKPSRSMRRSPPSWRRRRSIRSSSTAISSPATPLTPCRREN